MLNLDLVLYLGWRGAYRILHPENNEYTKTQPRMVRHLRRCPSHLQMESATHRELRQKSKLLPIPPAALWGKGISN